LIQDRRICSEVYSYYIEAVSAETNYISRSNISSIQVGAVASSPEYVQLNYVTVGDDKSIIVEWEPSHIPGVRNYIIDRYSDRTGWQEGYAYTKNTIWKDEYVAVKKEAYIYRIKVQDECGNVSLHSNAGRSILLEAKVEGENIKLAWNKPAIAKSDARNYFVQLQTSENQFTTLPRLPRDTSFLDETDHSAWNGAICYRIMSKGNNGIEDTSSSNVSCVILPSKLYIPTAFTPNNDGLNDEFKVNAAAMYKLTGNTDVDFHLRVYDRWGIMVFEATDVTKGWDGQVGDKVANPGIYTYSIYTVGLDKQHYHVEGTVMLMK
jgi:gliding motility-associated-like protein